jgi:hypothetical protein
MIEIELNWTETWIAAEVGKLRQFESLRKGLQDKYGFDGEKGWSIHIEGASGEMAVAKCLGVYWGGSVNTFRTQADVGRLEIRTRSRSDYDLLVRPDDKNDSIFVHVTGRSPKFKIHGWMKGADAKRPEWLQTYGSRDPAYFVPARFLKDMSQLRKDDVSEIVQRL